MISVAGIFPHRTGAKGSIAKLRSIGIPNERLVLLSPGAEDEQVEEVMPKVETDDRGTGEKIGSAVGRGIGIAGGVMLGGAVGSVFVPGVGAVLVAGVLAAALLGTGGAAIGAAAGSSLDETAAKNLRQDELHLYEASLRQGRTVMIALANDEKQAQAAREAMAQSGAESLDQARENWWHKLRAAEEAAYEREGRDFALDETRYRQGFEAALHPRVRSKTVAESVVLLGQYLTTTNRQRHSNAGTNAARPIIRTYWKSFPRNKRGLRQSAKQGTVLLRNDFGCSDSERSKHQ